MIIPDVRGRGCHAGKSDKCCVGTIVPRKFVPPAYKRTGSGGTLYWKVSREREREREAVKFERSSCHRPARISRFRTRATFPPLPCQFIYSRRFYLPRLFRRRSILRHRPTCRSAQPVTICSCPLIYRHRFHSAINYTPRLIITKYAFLLSTVLISLQ